jgi:hypothetical protein
MNQISVYQQMTGQTKCGKNMQQNIIQPLKKKDICINASLGLSSYVLSSLCLLMALGKSKATGTLQERKMDS